MTVDIELLCAGIDEAGRGPLAGPVIAAAVILDPNNPIHGLADSKTLSAKQRDKMFHLIYAKAWSVGVGRAEVAEIDQLNILQATLLAMQRAVTALRCVPHLAWVDGISAPMLPCKIQTIIKGDQTVPAISAASIVAKVTRDQEMQALDELYPGYGFAQHKGYPTAQHIVALQQLGASRIHRHSFAPVARVCLARS